MMLAGRLFLSVVWLAAATPAPGAARGANPLPHGGPVPQRGAPHISMPLHANTTVRQPRGPAALKPAGFPLQHGNAPHASVIATHAGVLGGPATSAAQRAGVLRATGLRRRPTAP